MTAQPPYVVRTSTGYDFGIPAGGPGNAARAIRFFLQVQAAGGQHAAVPPSDHHGAEVEP